MRVKLYNVRLAFPQLFTPSAFSSESEPRYSATFLLEPDHKNVKDITKAMQQVAKEKWGQKAQGVYKQLKAQDRLALHDGEVKSHYVGFEGNLYVSTSANPELGQVPCIVGRDNRPLKAEDGIPYAGCYVNASVEIWAQDNKWGKRINATLCTVQFVEDGERFGGGGSPARPDEFEPLEEAEESSGTNDFLDDGDDEDDDLDF